MLSITVITPTIGRANLDKLILSLQNQTGGFEIRHILLWDRYRQSEAIDPYAYNSRQCYSLVIDDNFTRKQAPGASLRAIGLMAANTEWIAFADDDVWFDDNHFETLFECMHGLNWATSYRRIWTPDGKECIGVDRFESVGDDDSRRVPYEMCDNNTMVFRRSYGSQAAVLYRETTERNDDRLMYHFLKTHAGKRGCSGRVTVNHICPPYLEDFFRENCSPASCEAAE